MFILIKILVIFFFLINLNFLFRFKNSIYLFYFLLIKIKYNFLRKLFCWLYKCGSHYICYNFIASFSLFRINHFFFKGKKKALNYSIFNKYSLYSLRISRNFCSKATNNTKADSISLDYKQCIAIIKSKKSKLYNSRCIYKAKYSNFCKKHKNSISSNSVKVCLGLTKLGLQCTRLVSENKEFCYQHISLNNNKTYLNKITNICGVVGLKTLPTASATVIICDPPYNIGKNFGNNFDNMEMSKYLSWCKEWILECKRVLSSNGLLYIYGFSEILAHIQIHCISDFNVRWLVWHYTNKTVPSAKMWQRSHESILCCYFDDPYFNRDSCREPYSKNYSKMNGKTRAKTKGRFSNGSKFTTYTVHPQGALPRDVIKEPTLAGNSKERVPHPTQKPVSLSEQLIKPTIRPTSDNLLVVPFSGSGSECVAAKLLGISFIGFELNKNYVTMANNRLACTQKRTFSTFNRKSFDSSALDKAFSKVINNYHEVWRLPLQGLHWEQALENMFEFCGYKIIERSSLKHTPGIDLIICGLGTISCKSANFNNKGGVKIASYRLGKLFKELNFSEEFWHQNLNKYIVSLINFNHYALLVWLKTTNNTYIYDFYLISTTALFDLNKPDVNWTHKTSNNSHTFRYNNLVIYSSMSYQLWININDIKSLKTYLISSATFKINPKINIIK